MRSLIAPQHVAAGLHAGTVSLVLQMVKPQPWHVQGTEYSQWIWCKNGEMDEVDMLKSGVHHCVWWDRALPGECMTQFAPFRVGQTLSVRETWNDSHGSVLYRADGEPLPCGSPTCHWKPAATMPREYARTFLTVTSVACVRAVDLTDLNLLKLGIDREYVGHDQRQQRRSQFEQMWTRLHGPEAMALWTWAIGVTKQ